MKFIIRWSLVIICFAALLLVVISLLFKDGATKRGNTSSISIEKDQRQLIPQNSAEIPRTLTTNKEYLDTGQISVSGIGFVDMRDEKFKNDLAAAIDAARNDAKQDSLDRVLHLMYKEPSLDKNFALIDRNILTKSDKYIEKIVSEKPPSIQKNGLLSIELVALVNRDKVVEKINELSQLERRDLIEKKGDPRISVQVSIEEADREQNFGVRRSQLAENVVKDRVKAFGFRVWANDGEVKNAESLADFHIQGEVRIRRQIISLPNSRLTMRVISISSWTIKALNNKTGEEVYLNTNLPEYKKWASEDVAVTSIGKMIGDEFSKDFFLQYTQSGVKRAKVRFLGVPDEKSRHQLTTELRSIRHVVDIQRLDNSDELQILVASEKNLDQLFLNEFTVPLNLEIGRECLTPKSNGRELVTIHFSDACRKSDVLARLEDKFPKGFLAQIKRDQKLKRDANRERT